MGFGPPGIRVLRPGTLRADLVQTALHALMFNLRAIGDDVGLAGLYIYIHIYIYIYSSLTVYILT